LKIPSSKSKSGVSPLGKPCPHKTLPKKKKKNPINKLINKFQSKKYEENLERKELC
jgi:hypothetical protein